MRNAKLSELSPTSCDGKLGNGGVEYIENCVPAVWTEEYGILQLVEFIDTSQLVQHQSVAGNKIASDGTAAIGGWFAWGSWSIAWDEIDVAKGSFRAIPELLYLPNTELYDIN